MEDKVGKRRGNSVKLPLAQRDLVEKEKSRWGLVLYPPLTSVVPYHLCISIIMSVLRSINVSHLAGGLAVLPAE